MKRSEVPPDGEQNYADSASIGSSPRSITEDPLAPKWDDIALSRVKLMCSYGGKILPRPHDNQLRYMGGETRIVVVNRNVSYAELVGKLSRLIGSSLIVKYQLPTEDLDALISVTSDEDLENMMEESDRLQTSNCPSRLRLFLFPAKLDSQSSHSDLLENNTNREHWFVDALNGMPIQSSRARSETSSIVSELPDYLSGLDTMEEWAARSHPRGSPLALLGAANSDQSTGEKLSAMPSSSLLHGSTEISSALDSPMNSIPIFAVQSEKDRLFQNRDTDENFMTYGASNSCLRHQTGSDAFKGTPDQRFLNDDISVKNPKSEQQGVEPHVISWLPSKPFMGLRTASNLQHINDLSMKTQPQQPLLPANTNIMNQEKFKPADTDPQPTDALESNQGNPGYTKVLSKAAEMKPQTEVQKMLPFVQGGDRTVKRASEEGVADSIVEHLRKPTDYSALRQKGESSDAFCREMSQGKDRQFADSNSSDVQRSQRQIEESSLPLPPPPIRAPFETSEIQQREITSPATSSQQLKQDRLMYAKIRDLHLESDDPASTYATQSPAALHHQMSLPTVPPNSLPPMINCGSPSRLCPSQSPPVHLRMTAPSTTSVYPVYSGGLPIRTETAINLPPSCQVPQLPRQTSDPLQHFQRISSPYKDHPGAHGLPSRFRGRPAYPNPTPHMKRVAIARHTQAMPPQSMTALAPPQHNDHQINYPVAAQAAYVDPNAMHANYALHENPYATSHSTGVNPFVNDYLL